MPKRKQNFEVTFDGWGGVVLMSASTWSAAVRRAIDDMWPDCEMIKWERVLDADLDTFKAIMCAANCDSFTVEGRCRIYKVAKHAA